MIEKFNKNKINKLKNQLDIGFFNYSENEVCFYVKYKNMKRIYNYGSFPFVYCIVEIRLKEIKRKISKNITEIIYRDFRKHFEYYKSE